MPSPSWEAVNDSESSASSRETPEELQVEQHPDKTFIGRITRGFSFLGYEFNEAGLTNVAQTTKEKFAERLHQLYEQGASKVSTDDYVRRWLIWVKSGLSELISSIWNSLTSSVQLILTQPDPNKESHY
jgi:hypothetical protein